MTIARQAVAHQAACWMMARRALFTRRLVARQMLARQLLARGPKVFPRTGPPRRRATRPIGCASSSARAEPEAAAAAAAVAEAAEAVAATARVGAACKGVDRGAGWWLHWAVPLGPKRRPCGERWARGGSSPLWARPAKGSSPPSSPLDLCDAPMKPVAFKIASAKEAKGASSFVLRTPGHSPFDLRFTRALSKILEPSDSSERPEKSTRGRGLSFFGSATQPDVLRDEAPNCL